MPDAPAAPVPAATETPPPAAPPPAADAKPAPAAPDLTKIIAREKRIRAEQEKLDAQRKEWAAERQALEQIKQARASRDPLTALRALGLSDDEVTTALVNRGQPATPEQEVKRLARDLEQYKAELAAKEQAAATERAKEQAAQIERQTQEFRERTARHVAGKADVYELINAEGAHAQVAAKIEEHYRATYDPDTRQGELLTADQAAEIVEKEIEERLAKATATKKWQAKVAKPPENALPKSAPVAPRRTIAELTSTTAAASPPKGKTREERFARALAVLESGKPLT
jgi:hypothetical protein